MMMKQINTPSAFLNKDFMLAALYEAKKALRIGEVPVGAVVVHNGKVIGRGYNRVEKRHNAQQHAEMIALYQATGRLKSWRLSECDLYVTLEPCAMCAGAITWSRISRVIYGARDPKAGACGSVLRVLGHPKLNHQPKIVPGVLANESQELLKTFFKALRQAKNKHQH